MQLPMAHSELFRIQDVKYIFSTCGEIVEDRVKRYSQQMNEAQQNFTKKSYITNIKKELESLSRTLDATVRS